MKSFLYMLAYSLLSQSTRRDIEVEQADDEYDFVVVGGGTTGSVVASRLSEDHNLRVLVLEAGGLDNVQPNILIPQYWTHLIGSDIDWKYRIKPQNKTEDLGPEYAEYWPRGKVIGGSSTIGGMMYIRGSPHDYNSWVDHGATGWGWKDVEPYFRKLEGAAEPDISKTLGRDGPLTITKKYGPPLFNMLLETAKKLGYRDTDYSESIEGASRVVQTASKGLRENSATAYLYPVLPERKERLHILLNALATKIVFDRANGDVPKAKGVEYVKDGKLKFVKARKEVILSAGTIGTPHLLMLSGIGDRKHSEEMEVEPIVHLQGVGQNLQDHPFYITYFHATNMPRDLVLNPELLNERLDEYIKTSRGLWLTSNGLSMNLHIRTGLDDISASTSQHPFPDIQILTALAANETAVFAPRQDPENAKWVSFFFATALAHPKSRGTIRLKSRDPKEYPEIDARYFTNEDDMELMMEAARRVEEFEASDLFRSIGAKMIMPSDCKKYHQEDPPRHKALHRCLVPANMLTGIYICGTAKMGQSDDEMAVVDPRLKVRRPRPPCRRCFRYAAPDVGKYSSDMLHDQR